MHLTLKQETASPPAPTMRSQQRRFDKFRPHFNEDRPHEALGQRCPSECYTRSTREYVAKAAPTEYPSNSLTRSVQKNGQIKLFGGRSFVSECLVGRRVGLVEIEDDIWQVFYRHHSVCTLTRRRNRIMVGVPGAPGSGT